MCLCLCPLRERRKRTAYTFWIHWSRRAFRPGRRGQARDRCRREWRALWLSSPGRPYASSRSPAFRYWSRSSWWRASLSPCGRSESESVFSSVYSREEEEEEEERKTEEENQKNERDSEFEPGTEKFRSSWQRLGSNLNWTGKPLFKRFGGSGLGFSL